MPESAILIGTEWPDLFSGKIRLFQKGKHRCWHVQIHYNSCCNHCCPICQAVPKEMWMDARREDVVEAPYFHLFFTVPDILNPLIYCNQKLLYDALYHAASATISELAADPAHLGASVGYICILHTWGSEMNFHPHIHTILLGGGLTACILLKYGR